MASVGVTPRARSRSTMAAVPAESASATGSPYSISAIYTLPRGVPRTFSC